MRFKKPLPLSILRAPVIFIIAGSSVALPQEIKFEHISLQQGLSQTSVFSIAQDRKGFMWFATQDGLNRYDGYSFLVYRHDPQDSSSLSDNYVTALLVTRDGTLWAGTRGGGLNRFIPRTAQFTHYRHDPLNVRTISNDEVRCIYEDRAGALWVGTTGGLCRYDAATDRFKRFTHEPGNSRSIPPGLVQCLFEDKSGLFWVGLLGTLGTLDRSTGEFTRGGLGFHDILTNQISQDSVGNIWAGLQNSTYIRQGTRWIQSRDLMHTSTPHAVRVILKGRNGTMWFGADAGLNRYDIRNRRLTTFLHDPLNPLSISGNSVNALFEDKEGILWVGTFDGINKYAPAQFKFRHLKWGDTQSSNGAWNKVRGFSEDKHGMIWVATQSGLATFDRRSDKLTRISTDAWYSAENNLRLLWSLLVAEGPNGQALWVGTNGQGLINMSLGNPGAPSFSKFLPEPGNPRSLSGPSPVALCETRDGTLWAGTLWEGLNRFNKKTRTFDRFVNDPSNPHSISGNEIWTLCEGADDALWVGTGGEGLNKLDRRTGEFMRYRHDPADSLSLSDDKVTAVVAGSQDILWVGTYTGLNKFDTRNGVFRHFTTRDGLPDNVVYAIVDDRAGNLWLSTNNGLSRFTIAQETFRNFDAGDGLQSNEFNHGAAFRCRDGEILFGGVDGFNIFSPSGLVEDNNVPAVVLTDFKVFNKSVDPSPTEQRLTTHITSADAIHLSYRDAVLSFEFASLEFTNPLKNRYAYRMEGFDKDWVSAGSKREATYTNLDPGTYVFRVKAANSDGVWNEAGTSILLTITPPLWQTWWFRCLAVLALLSTALVVYRRRVRDLEFRQATQQEFARRLIGSQEAERKRVSAELHDSIGQDLLVIKNKLLLGLQSQDGGDERTDDFREAIDYVSNSLKHVREISRNLRPVQLDQIGLTAALESLVETVAESSHISADVKVDKLDNLLSKEGEINIFRIVQESLNNILKHSNASAVRVEMKKSGRGLSVTVEDNGRGMDTSVGAAPRGLGLSSMEERARILGGDLQIESTPGKGTRVRLSIPIREERHG